MYFTTEMVKVCTGLGNCKFNTIIWSIVRDDGFDGIWRPSEVTGKRTEVGKS
jgi:hypothetical protein